MVPTSIAILALLIALSAAACGSKSDVPTSSILADNSRKVATPSGSAPRVVKTIDGVPIHYRVHGRGDPAVILVHGWSCDSSYWDEQIPALTAKYTVITLDLAGHGASGQNRTNWSIKQSGEDVAAVVRQIPNPHVVLVGHSMGGPIVLEAAQRLGSRVIGIIGVDTLKSVSQFPMAPKDIEELVAPFRDDFRGYTRKVVMERMFVDGTDPQLVRRIADDMALGPPEVLIPLAESNARLDVGALLRATEAPIIVINAAYGGPTEQERIRQWVPSFRAVILDGMGHFPMLEQPQRFNQVLLREISRIVDSADR